MACQTQIAGKNSGMSKEQNIKDGGIKTSAQSQKLGQIQQQTKTNIIKGQGRLESEKPQGQRGQTVQAQQMDTKTQIVKDEKKDRSIPKAQSLIQDETFSRVKDQATSPMPAELLQKKTARQNVPTTTTSSSSTTSTSVSAGTPIVPSCHNLPHRQNSSKTSSVEVDAILARKISSTDISSSKERPFVENKIIHPPPKTHIKGTPVGISSSSIVAQREKASVSKGGAIKENEKETKDSATKDQQTPWRDVGEVEVLRRLKCRRIYAKDGQDQDVALFYRGGTFFALEAWCSHMGGPLFQGDIEDYKGSSHVMCPWHAYMFDLTTGRSEIGLEQKVFPVRIQQGRLQIQHDSKLSIYPFL